jgi:hypothetical protein
MIDPEKQRKAAYLKASDLTATRTRVKIFSVGEEEIAKVDRTPDPGRALRFRLLRNNGQPGQLRDEPRPGDLVGRMDGVVLPRPSRHLS